MHSTLLGYFVISGWLVSKGDVMLPTKTNKLGYFSNVTITDYAIIKCVFVNELSFILGELTTLTMKISTAPTVFSQTTAGISFKLKASICLTSCPTGA